MTKIEFVYLIKNLLAPVDKTNRYHPAQIAAVCDIVYAELMASAGSEFVIDDLGAYQKVYPNVVVSYDSDKERYYSTLPAAICPIPGITSGVRQINSVASVDLDYAPTTELDVYYLDGSVAATTDTTIWYWLQGITVWYYDSMTADIAAEGVNMTLLPRFSAYSDSDIVMIPGCTDTSFCQKVLQFLVPTVPVDLKATNA